MYSNDYVQKSLPGTIKQIVQPSFLKHSDYCHICNHKICICCTCILPCEHTSLSVVTVLLLSVHHVLPLSFHYAEHIPCYCEMICLRVIYRGFFIFQMAKPRTLHYLMPMTEPIPPLTFQPIRVRNLVCIMIPSK